MGCVLLTGVVALALAPGAGAQLFEESYDAVFTFTDAAALSQTRMTAAFDGVDYWSSSGGGPGGNRLARYDVNGNLQELYQPNIDMRSIFTEGDSDPLYARGYNSPQIRVQTAPGVFGNDVVLTGGTLNAQSAVVFTTDGTEFRAMNAGSVSRWDRQGNFIGSIALSGFGSMNNENVYPQNRGMASGGDYMLTYANGVLSAWDDGGNRVDTTRLNGAGTTFDSHFSISYANGMVFVVDVAGGQWRGYDVGLGGGGGCVYKVKKSKPKGGCDNCPPKGGEYRSKADCEDVKDCDKKVKTTIACPGGGNGTCKIKGKRSSCG
ncbi:MAG: hypothetical protein C4547_10850 [Phycisphaerales bacterium]|nr:MAG: hypothetical protein C4547_10850 [Phycisphaerales bacterium]